MAAPNRAQADRDCPHCKSALPRLATVCPSCGRWAVETRLAPAAQVLRGVGYAWVVLSLLGAVLVSQFDTPLPGGALAVAVVMALQGLLLGLAAVVLAEHGPRAPE